MSVGHFLDLVQYKALALVLGRGPRLGIQYLDVVGEEPAHRFGVIELQQQTRVLGILVKALIVDHFVPDQQVPVSTHTRGYTRPRQ